MAIIKNKMFRKALEKNKKDFLSGKINWTKFLSQTKSARKTFLKK